MANIIITFVQTLRNGLADNARRRQEASPAFEADLEKRGMLHNPSHIRGSIQFEQKYLMEYIEFCETQFEEFISYKEAADYINKLHEICEYELLSAITKAMERVRNLIRIIDPPPMLQNSEVELARLRGEAASRIRIIKDKKRIKYCRRQGRAGRNDNNTSQYGNYKG